MVRVLENSKQLGPNPFQGHDEVSRRITNLALGGIWSITARGGQASTFAQSR
jgi:hypothetical protein